MVIHMTTDVKVRPGKSANPFFWQINVITLPGTLHWAGLVKRG